MNINEAFELYRQTRDAEQPTVECIEKLYPLVREKVKRTIRFTLIEEPDEDLVVTATTDVLISIDKFKGDAQFSTWVESVVRNICIDEIKRRQRNRNSSVQSQEFPEFQAFAFDRALDYPEEAEPWRSKFYRRPTSQKADAADPDGRTNEDVDYSELYERFETVLQDEERQILRAKLGGLSGQEIADLVGIPHGTLRRRWLEIKQKLAEHFPVYEDQGVWKRGQ